MRTLHLIPAMVGLAGLSACSGFSNQEAHMVFEESNRRGVWAFVDAWTDSETPGARDSASFVFTEDGEDSWSFTGELIGTSDWTGTILLDGALTLDGNAMYWDYGYDYLDVTSDGITMNGGMDWALDLEGDHDSASLTLTALGEISATGDAEGTGEIDYEANVEVDGNSFSFVAEGVVDGTPIDSSFTLLIN